MLVWGAGGRDNAEGYEKVYRVEANKTGRRAISSLSE
jgi:hypothetical protein